tara:strand:+ start:2957 stop:3649 length:693 start_codon:yes stop_codon:yes gene_type:complete
MKQIFFTFLLSFQFLLSQAQIDGAWEYQNPSDQTETLVFVNGYFSHSTFSTANGEFVATHGGRVSETKKQLSFTLEFDTEHKENVGKTVDLNYRIKSKIKLYIGDKIYVRTDNGTEGDLNGAWLMSGRKREGKIQTRSTDGPRKTMKILSGKRFQWIAYNTATGDFFGTGGGSYTTIDGNYTENIEFFSRDNSRVGAALTFDYELIDNNWHHSGFSSKGAPLYEIWSQRE